MTGRFKIDITRTAYGHLASFQQYDRNRIFDGIKDQLTHQPNLEARNRKELRDNPIADWELRIDPFRIFYEVDEESRVVTIVGVGIKERDKLIIDGEEIRI
ncbi:MAG TPA: type II toxin-antitoxin system RelE/ParE family toxin [Thermoanaerobaculia bacterium]|jgi:mRNA-degrading endonuclease RelE of RelBE toxin-antitoxin system